MNIEGTYTFAAPRDVVWPMMLDPDVLANAMPGCEKLEQTGENSYSGILNIRVGPVQGRFNGTIDLSEINAPEGYQLTLKGNGAPGFVNGTGTMELVDEGDSCTVKYTSDAQVGGRLAGVGQRLLETSARAIVRQSLEALEQQINAKMHPETDADGAVVETAVNPPSQTAFAAGVAKNMLTEIIPPEQQEKAKVAGAVTAVLTLLAMLLFIVRVSGKARRRRHANEIADILEARARRYNN
jgi:hypothetical protein